MAETSGRLRLIGMKPPVCIGVRDLLGHRTCRPDRVGEPRRDAQHDRASEQRSSPENGSVAQLHDSSPGTRPHFERRRSVTFWISLLATAFVLHAAWEWLQCRLFFVHGTLPETSLELLRATVGDVVLTLVTYTVVAASARSFDWRRNRWSLGTWLSLVGSRSCLASLLRCMPSRQVVGAIRRRRRSFRLSACP